jgi:hypothetical protein
MQDLGYELRRIPIPLTRVNKGRKKGQRLEMSRPFFLPIVLQRSRRSLFIAYFLSRALCVQAYELCRWLAIGVERHVDCGSC